MRPGKQKSKRAPAAKPAAEAPPAAAPPIPKALPLATRQAIQAVLLTIERTNPALRNAGQFGLLGLLSQAGHALKLLAEHSHALERHLALEPQPPAEEKPHSNGVTA